MMTVDSVRKPVMVFHISEMIADELEARGWTGFDVAKRMSDKKSPTMHGAMFDLAMAVHKDGLILSDEFLVHLDAAFGMSDGYFKRLHQMWLDNPEARQPFTFPDHLFAKTVEFTGKVPP
jgi:hypothetical protein